MSGPMSYDRSSKYCNGVGRHARKSKLALASFFKRPLNVVITVCL